MPCTHKSRLFGNRWLPQTTCADCALDNIALLTGYKMMVIEMIRVVT